MAVSPKPRTEPKAPNPNHLALVARFLEDLQGLVDDPEAWFRTPNPVFENRQPIDLVGTSDEPRMRNRIAAAKLGMFS